MQKQEHLESPKNLRLTEEGNYTITQRNNRKQVYIPTDSRDGYKLLVIKGSGLDTWGINDEKLFPKSESLGYMKGDKAAVAVLDGEKLIGFAYGRDNGGTMTFDCIQKAYDDVPKIVSRITVKTKNIGKGSTIIDDSDADKLADLVVKSTTAGIERSKRFPVAEAGFEDKSPTLVAAVPVRDKFNSPS
ncbi:MAG: hypothetical protein ABL867_03025 [Rickettsiales bacterium]